MVPLRIHFNNFGDPLTFPLEPPTGQSLILPKWISVKLTTSQKSLLHLSSQQISRCYGDDDGGRGKHSTC